MRQGYRRTSPSSIWRVFNSALESAVAVMASAPISFLLAISSAAWRLAKATMHSSSRLALRPRLNSPENFQPATTVLRCDGSAGVFKLIWPLAARFKVPRLMFRPKSGAALPLGSSR
jgi:hypothetical protein